jgi:PHD/YefM family antitoxin component YafN of YafNO toxin-antitoxin module
MMQTIKKILAKNKNACVIIMEDNEPAFVVIGFKEYEKMANNENEDFIADDFLPEADEDILEEVNSEIINLGAPQSEVNSGDAKEQNMQIIEENPMEMSMQEIKIEDIPL